MSTILIQNDDQFIDAESYGVEGNTLSFATEGGALQQEPFLRTYTNDQGVPVFVFKEKGVSRGTFVRCRFTEAQLKAAEENPEDPMHIAAKVWYGPKSFKDIEKRTLKVQEETTSITLFHEETEKEVTFDVIEFKTPDIQGVDSMSIPKDWLEELPEGEQEKAQIEDEAREILGKMNQIKQQDRSEALRQYSDLMDRLGRMTEALRAINTKDPADYVVEQMNAKYRFVEAIMEDKRVLKVEEVDEKVYITTDYLTVKIQGCEGSDGDIELPIGPVVITMNLRGGAPYYKYAISSNVNAHFHDLGGGKLCIGRYGGKYSELLSKKDLFSAFQIVIEVLTNANLDDTALNENEVLCNILDDDFWDYEGDWDEVQKQFDDSVRPNLDKKYETWKKDHPKKVVFETKKFDEETIRQVVANIK